MNKRSILYLAIALIVLLTVVLSWIIYSNSNQPQSTLAINFSSPQNKTYNTHTVPLTYLVNIPTSWVGYSLDAKANVTVIGNSSLNELSEGSHNIMLYANDSSGKSWSSDILYFAIDTFPPEITILSPENRTYNAASVPLSIAVNEAISRIDYSLDGKANATILGNTTLTGLSNGSHVLSVYAIDLAGNMGTSRVSFVVVQATGTQIQTFESGLDGWVADADVPLDPNNPGYPVEGRASLVSNFSRSGENSLMLFIDGTQDDGTVWIEKEFDAPINSRISVLLSFWFYSAEKSDNELAVVCAYTNLANPEVEADFAVLGSANEGAGWREYSLMTNLFTDSSDTLWVAIGISVRWETFMTYYVDDIEIQIE